MTRVVEADSAYPCLLHQLLGFAAKLVRLERSPQLVDHDIPRALVGLACLLGTGEATLWHHLRRWWRPAYEPTPAERRAVEVRAQLEHDYLELAATDADLSEALVERAHAVRPTTWT
ncbi:hypothetical protein [Streptomyces tailanensis]|uniref:hypothetical protein n=1 Tax=Streptomyces tailanensis TaxID=2569858 RepID=UPI001FE70C3E|nr:hypothetical protein [Streptomyces tailanensis]